MSIDQIRFVMAALLSTIILQHPSTTVHTLDICNNSTNDLKPAIITCLDKQRDIRERKVFQEFSTHNDDMCDSQEIV